MCDSQEEKAVARKKDTISDEVLFKDCPHEWIKILQHVRSLNFEARPDYKFVFNCLQETLIRLKASYSDPWDWELVVSPIVQIEVKNTASKIASNA